MSSQYFRVLLFAHQPKDVQAIGNWLSRRLQQFLRINVLVSIVGESDRSTAVARFREGPFHLVITEADLEEDEDIDLVQAIRAAIADEDGRVTSRSEVKIVVFSTTKLGSKKQQYIAAGANEVFETDLDTVRHWLLHSIISMLAETRPVQAHDIVGHQPVRILSVNDNRDSLEILEVFLLAHMPRVVGVPVQCVSMLDGNSALLELERSRFDLVLTDWMMPGITGPELIVRIRSSTRAADERCTRSDVPIVMYSARDVYEHAPMDPIAYDFMFLSSPPDLWHLRFIVQGILLHYQPLKLY